MSCYVVVTDSEGFVSGLYGPFEDHDAAETWGDEKIASEAPEWLQEPYSIEKVRDPNSY